MLCGIITPAETRHRTTKETYCGTTGGYRGRRQSQSAHTHTLGFRGRHACVRAPRTPLRTLECLVCQPTNHSINHGTPNIAHRRAGQRMFFNFLQ